MSEKENNPNLGIPLFPFYAKFLGLFLILTGLASGYYYFFLGKPAFFNVPAFAVISSYLETKYFVLIHTNVLDEMAAVFLVTGLLLLAFSEEKHEKPVYRALRLKSLVMAVFCSVMLWILLFLIIFGYFVFVVPIVVFISFFIFYIAFFRYYVRREGNK